MKSNGNNVLASGLTEFIDAKRSVKFRCTFFALLHFKTLDLNGQILGKFFSYFSMKFKFSN
jgi:hypothetical protein